jgi:DNA-binding NarL/FixJ family response regulator
MESCLVTPARRQAPDELGQSNGALFSEVEWAQISFGLRLSPQQRRIVMLLVNGLCDKQISRAMGIAVPTVRTHVSRLFAKVNVHDRVELMRELFREFRRGCHQCPRHRERLR